ncbi:MAG TPA: hypothetical protein VH062_27055 [Polyangiaceae bacterium]|nr:hypothetical protein [Polyangiaceae bacterium]
MSRWRSSSGRAVAALGFVAVIGCSSRDEIVAKSAPVKSGIPDGGITSPPSTAPCEPGSYSGSIFTTPRDGGISVQYSGKISFNLTESLSGEFVVLDDKAKLAGTGMDGSTFDAEIVGGSRCTEGSFTTELQNGTYTLYNADKSSSTSIPFDGMIRGSYVAEYLSFIGSWSANLHIGGMYPDIIVGGNWSATHGQ